jgi:oxaloacetate decarboxylase alpha subunit
MEAIRFVDTTLRDGQQSLWAYGMRTGMMVPIAADLEAAGFEAIELGTPVELVKCVRELREDPWERHRLLAARIRKTPLRAIHGTRSGFEIYPEAIHYLWDKCMAEIGIRQVRISDSWNDPADWRWRVAQAREVGLEPILNLIYTVSPRHTDEYYAEKARAAVRLGVFRVCLKDPGGLLTPERTRTLAPAVLAAAGETEVELHTHCTTGLGVLCALEAVRAGIRSVNTAVPPLANGSSNPSVFTVAHNARAMGYETEVEEAPLRQVADYLHLVAKREGLPIGTTPEYDYFQYVHQIPGGMISNLRHQLRRVGMEEKLEETLHEAARVRAEFGYPIMVTPLSQFVGSQAAINVIVGERYRQVTDQTIQYALGVWGKEGAELMDAEVKDKILSRPRARELAKWEKPRASAEELRWRLGGPALSDEELLLRFFTSEEDVKKLRAAGPPPLFDARTPLLVLLEELSKKSDRSTIYFQKGDLSLRLEKGTI